jgi:NAD(P)-dependent dehydrogenase (short-subunit alcohol dehydrogenase family)
MQSSTDLTSKTALVTGATSGIGFHTAAGLARLGATVYVTGRDARRGQAAEQQLRAGAGHPRVQFLPADAATVGGNQDLARRVLAQTDRLHILVNNVGGTFNERHQTADGYEATLATILVGPFALTQALLPVLRASAPARIVNVASMSHRLFKGDPFADLHSRQGYITWRAYARAKLLNVLWTRALARRLEGSGGLANSADPGGAWTAMTQSLTPAGMPAWMRPIWPVLRFLQRRGSPADAARSSIFLASAPEAAGLTGAYVGPTLRPQQPSKAALDRGDQERAWALAVQLVADAGCAGDGVRRGRRQWRVGHRAWCRDRPPAGHPWLRPLAGHNLWGSRPEASSWLLGRSAASLGTGLWVLALFAFLIAGVGAGFHLGWWRSATVLATVVSLLALGLFWDRRFWIGLGVDVAVLAGLLWLRWPPIDVLGA